MATLDDILVELDAQVSGEGEHSQLSYASPLLPPERQSPQNQGIRDVKLPDSMKVYAPEVVTSETGTIWNSHVRVPRSWLESSNGATLRSEGEHLHVGLDEATNLCVAHSMY